MCYGVLVWYRNARVQSIVFHDGCDIRFSARSVMYRIVRSLSHAVTNWSMCPDLEAQHMLKREEFVSLACANVCNVCDESVMNQ